MTDQIQIKLQKDGKIERAVITNLEYIKAETLTAVLDFEDAVSNGVDVAFDEVNTKLFIEKF